MIYKRNNWFIQLIFPQPKTCIICENQLNNLENYVCNTCFQNVRRVYPPLCSNCGRPIGDWHQCLHCQERKFLFNDVYSWGIYDGVLRNIIHHFKFRRYSPLGYVLMEKMLSEMDIVDKIAGYIIVPVPLYAKREKNRGYNQAQVLCEALAKFTGLPVKPVLYRKSFSQSQAGLSLNERQKVVKGQFSVNKKWSKWLVNKKILLVDDVITTGSTLNECSKALLRHGVSQIKVLTVATTLLK